MIDLTTNTALPTLVTTPSPDGVAVDTSAAKVYWSSPLERLVRRSPIASPASSDWLSVGPDVGERPSDGPDYMDCVVNGWARPGTAGTTALPYQIKLTGATFVNVAAMICKDNTTRVVLGGDSLASTGNRTLTAVGSSTGPVRISDRGLVAWRGQWFTSTNALRRGLFLGTDKLIDSTTVPDGGGNPLGDVDGGQVAFDMSSNGRYLMANTNYGAFVVGGNSAATIAFASIPGCAADFNEDGTLSVQDIFDFLNAWFAGNLSSDYDGSGVLSVQDIFDFLNGWFAGCP